MKIKKGRDAASVCPLRFDYCLMKCSIFPESGDKKVISKFTMGADSLFIVIDMACLMNQISYNVTSSLVGQASFREYQVK